MRCTFAWVIYSVCIHCRARTSSPKHSSMDGWMDGRIDWMEPPGPHLHVLITALNSWIGWSTTCSKFSVVSAGAASIDQSIYASVIEVGSRPLAFLNTPSHGSIHSLRLRSLLHKIACAQLEQGYIRTLRLFRFGLPFFKLGCSKVFDPCGGTENFISSCHRHSGIIASASHRNTSYLA